MIESIKEILREPYSIKDMGASVSRILPFFALILSLIGLVVTAFFSWQNSLMTVSLGAASAMIRDRDKKIEFALSSLEVPGELSLDPSRVNKLQGILQEDKRQIEMTPVLQAEELKREGNLSFTIYSMVAGLFTIALVFFLIADCVRGTRYLYRTKGSDRVAFRIYDRVVAGSNYSRASIETITTSEAPTLLRDRRDEKIARIFHLFQSTRLGGDLRETPIYIASNP